MLVLSGAAFCKAMLDYDLISGLLEEFPLNDANFARRLYSGDLSRYHERIDRLGISSDDIILDAGCGFGQWSIAMTEKALEVHAYEIDYRRIDLIETLKSKLQVSNLHPKQGRLEDLPFRDSQFDFIIAYGSLFLTRWKESLAELLRTLKPGGRLYMTLNDIGWYLYLWDSEHNRDDLYDPKGDVPRILRNTLAMQRMEGLDHAQPDYHSIISQTDLKEFMVGFSDYKVEYLGEEGSYYASGKKEKQPFFISEYKSLPAVYDVVVRRIR